MRINSSPTRYTGIPIHGFGFITAQMLDRSEWHHEAVDTFGHYRKLREIPATQSQHRLAGNLHRVTNALGGFLILAGSHLQSADTRIESLSQNFYA